MCGYYIVSIVEWHLILKIPFQMISIGIENTIAYDP